MKKTDNNQTSSAEMVTISRAEYEEFQAQRKKISELESRVDVLMEALRLARHKQFGASSEKSEDTLMEQLSFLFNEAEVFSAAEKEAEEKQCIGERIQIELLLDQYSQTIYPTAQICITAGNVYPVGSGKIC